MKIAVLMLVHKNVDQVNRLLSYFQHENVDVFIHIDKKSSISPENIKASNVYFTSRRYDIELFEFSMVDAEMELLRRAKQQGTYGYYILMSGQCYPLMGIGKMYNYLCSHYPEPFIEIVAPTEKNYVKTNFRHVYMLKRFKLRTYAFLKRHFSYKMYRILRYIPGGFVFLVSGIKELFVKSPKTRLSRKGWPSYCGSQWWILPDPVIDRALELYRNEEFCRIVSDCFSCDETFFQTAMMIQQEENGITLDEQGNFMNRKWFFIFDHGHPIILTKEHHAQIQSSGMLFARKFDTKTDTEILDILDMDRNESV